MNSTCHNVQNLIDKQTNSKLSVLQEAKVFFHKLFCKSCTEYENRGHLFASFLKPDNHGRINCYQKKVIERSKSVVSRLASIPEMSPVPILEIERSGRISYQNPAFMNHFPDFSEPHHIERLMPGFSQKTIDLLEGSSKGYTEEIYHNGKYFINRITYISELQVIRIFFEEITEQKISEKIIIEKNKEIIDSINYAKRIQQAILPTDDKIKSVFPESFVLYKPKDIVAGDFYWLSEKQNTTFIAAADCTGHGVPGALVSMICNNALNRSINEFGLTNPGEILDKSRELVTEAFTNDQNGVMDGMDISLLAIDNESGEVFWSGANNPLWYSTGNGIMEIIADKQPIGNSFNPKPFKSHKLDVKKGDTLFLFTDGYADQFGGPKNKKFRYKQLMEVLTKYVSSPMQTIKENLDQILTEWKGSLEQTDDVLIIGLKV